MRFRELAAVVDVIGTTDRWRQLCRQNNSIDRATIYQRSCNYISQLVLYGTAGLGSERSFGNTSCINSTDTISTRRWPCDSGHVVVTMWLRLEPALPPTAPLPPAAANLQHTSGRLLRRSPPARACPPAVMTGRCPRLQLRPPGAGQRTARPHCGS